MNKAVDDLQLEYEKIKREEKKAYADLDSLKAECSRVADFARYSRKNMAEITGEFQRQTRLDKMDMSFLGIATALQVTRWALIAAFSDFGDGFDPDDRMKENDKTIKQKMYDERSEYKNGHYAKGDEVINGDPDSDPDWLQILYKNVPYDTVKGTAQFGLSMSGKNHRYKTLGHDPVLGWIFGTCNIMTRSLTTNSFDSFNVRGGEVVDRVATPLIFKRSYESTKKDPKRLAAAIVAQGIHLRSDEYTKIGLPIPCLSGVSEPLAEKLVENHYDKLCFSRDLEIVAMQAGLAVFINTIISMVHRLFYDPNSGISEDVYAVKTRRILDISNVIASSSNVLYCGLAAYATGPKAWKKLDFGGLGVMLYRLITDTKFIYKVRREFVREHFSRSLLGDDYDELISQVPDINIK